MAQKQPTLEQRLAGVDKMLWKKAWSTWHKLPDNVRHWLEPEDLYQEGLLHLYSNYNNWDPAKASFFTYAFMVTDNRMSTILAYWKAKKRLAAGGIVDLEKVDMQPAKWKDTDSPPLQDPILRDWYEIDAPQPEQDTVLLAWYGAPDPAPS